MKIFGSFIKFSVLLVFVFLLASCGSSDGDDVSIVRTITVTSSGNGTVWGNGDFNVGDSISVEATASEGYVFLNWTDANDSSLVISTNSRYSFDVSETISLVANFTLENTRVQYYFTVGADDHISFTAVSDTTGYYNEGDTITVIAVIEEGYVFAGWWVTNGSTSSENWTLVSSNLIYTFELTEETWLLARIN